MFCSGQRYLRDEEVVRTLVSIIKYVQLCFASVFTIKSRFVGLIFFGNLKHVQPSKNAKNTFVKYTAYSSYHQRVVTGIKDL